MADGAGASPRPALSAIQAKLRKGTGQAKAGPEGLKRAPEQEPALPPPKKRALPTPGGDVEVAVPLVSPKVPIAKIPAGVAKSKAVGLFAKSAAAPLATVSKAESVAVTKRPSGSPLLLQTQAKRPAVPGTTPLPPKSAPIREPEGQQQDGAIAAISGLIAVIEAAPSQARQRHVHRLAEAIGSSLQIEHLNQFLRVLKKQIVDRAAADGIRAVPALKEEGTPVPPPAKAVSKVAEEEEGSADAMPAEAADEALYGLIGEFAQDPVCKDGAINEPRLAEVLKRLWAGAARRPKDWVVAWQAMTIPQEKQVEALQKLLNLAFGQTEDPEKAPIAVAELVKSHKVKMKSVEDVLNTFGQNLDGITAMNEDAWQFWAQFLVHVFPKPAANKWGWSRIGWSWDGWWKFVEQCVASLEAQKQFDVLALLLRLVQDREGQSLRSLQVWTDSERLDKVLTRLAELAACGRAEIHEKLSLQGVIVE